MPKETPVLNFLLDNDTLNLLSTQFCPSYLLLKNIKTSICNKTDGTFRICKLCWRKALIEHNAKVEKQDKKEIMVIDKSTDSLNYCTTCGGNTLFINGRCVICKHKEDE